MAILCLDNGALRLEGHSFIGELALDGSVRPVKDRGSRSGLTRVTVPTP
jgi:hypothetical protein